MASGENLSQRSGSQPVRMAGLLARGSRRRCHQHQQMPTFPTLIAVMKTGRFVDKEASAPIDHAATSVAYPVRASNRRKTPLFSVALASGPVTFASPLYSRGVGCDKDARIGSIPPHSLLILKAPLLSGTIRTSSDRTGAAECQSLPRHRALYKRPISALTPSMRSKPTRRSSSAAISSSAAST